VALGTFLLAAGGREAAAALSLDRPIEVKVLYDNSGSMYPGYAPPGRGGTPKSVSGARFYYEYPEFREWLGDFVARQTVLNGGNVSMSVLTSWDQFTPDNIRQVHPRVPIAGFDIERAVRAFPREVGSSTYLTEALQQFTRGFEGIVWLITDNIVETRLGEPDQGVAHLFTTLRDEHRFRSVHLFKYPFRDAQARQDAALAVYGIVVSDGEVPAATLAYLDRKFRTDFCFATQRRGDPPARLFPDGEHLKLKDLSIDTIELRAEPVLRVEVQSRDRGLFVERQQVRLELQGEIRSNLTQHSVTGGTYTLEPVGDFVPENWARARLALADIPKDSFAGVRGTLTEPIPPNGSQSTKATLLSKAPLSISNKSFLGWLRTALSGAVVQYTGTVQMSFGDIQVRLERSRMAGVFGVDQASSIFDFQNVQTIHVGPSQTQVSFVMKTGSQRTLLLIAAALLLGTPAVLGFLVLRRRARYRIQVSGSPASVVALRRLGSYEIFHEGNRLGRLSRGLLGGHRFEPTLGGAASPDSNLHEVRLSDGSVCRLTIEPAVAEASSTAPATGRAPILNTTGAPSPTPPANQPAGKRPTIARPKS
jgi:hypothetical protein